MDRFAAEEAFIIQNKLRKHSGVSEIKWDENLYKICKFEQNRFLKIIGMTLQQFVITLEMVMMV